MKLSVAFFFVLAISSATFADNGKDGSVGEIGNSGIPGRNGRVSINFMPRVATPEFAYYMPISSCDVNEVKLLLINGLSVNLPMKNTNKMTPFQMAVENGCVEVIRIMILNPDTANRPNLRLPMVDQNESPVELYRSLIIDDDARAPNISVRPNNLAILKLIIPYETDAQSLEKGTSQALDLLLSPRNGYLNFPANIEAVDLIDARIKVLGR